jgi:hypothetical protein
VAHCGTKQVERRSIDRRGVARDEESKRVPDRFRHATIERAGAKKMINVDEGGWPIRGESVEEC